MLSSRTVIVLGASYGGIYPGHFVDRLFMRTLPGAKALSIFASQLPPGWRVLGVDRNS